MKIAVYFLAFFVLGCQESDQSRRIDTEVNHSEQLESELPSNSFEHDFAGTNIHYSYIEKTQTHDYSENWDFDGDGINDSILFVGNGGAHLYFDPVVKLSSNSKKQTFEWLSTDFPALSPVESLKEFEKSEFTPINFVVSDFNGDHIDDFFIRIDRTNQLPAQFSHVQPENRKFVVYFEKKLQRLVVEEWRKITGVN